MRLVLTADWHLDRSNRLDDFVKSVTHIVNYATEHQVQKFFILGDLYRDWRASPVEKDVLHRLLVKLHKFKIDTYIVLGNHDVDDKDVSNKLTSAQELETLKALNVHVIAEPELIPVQDKTILALPHLSRRYMEKARKKFGDAVTYTDVLGSLAAHNPSLVVGHMYLPEAVLGASDVGMDSFRAVKLESLREIFKAPMFFGDIHKPQQLCDTPPIIYVGSPDRINFGEADHDKRFIEYNLYNGDTVSHPIPTRAFLEIKANLDARIISLAGCVAGDMPLGEGPYMDCLRAFLKAIGQYVEGSVVKLTVFGHKNNLDQVIRTEISEALRGMGPALVKAITFTATDNTAIRDVKYSELLTDKEAFSYWLGQQQYSGDMLDRVRQAGMKLLG